MSLLFRGAPAARALGDTPNEIVPTRSSGQMSGAVHVDADTALKQSAVWAALRIRANLVSSLPCDVYRKAAGFNVPVPTPPVLVSPDGEQELPEWLWATQFDLDRFGNVFGLITERDGFGLPARIELVATMDVTVRARGSKVLFYRIAGTRYEVDEVWHERQYRMAGYPVGLNVMEQAAGTIGGYLSAQRFALDFYRAGGMPAGVLKNTEQEIPNPADIDKAKAMFRAATTNRDIFVTGKDWDWSPAESDAAASAYLEELKWGSADVARWFDVPADLIDAAMSGQSITYANIGQRQTQLLVDHIGPAVGRRERSLGRLTPKPRYVKLNSDAMLRMDPETRARVLLADVAGRVRTVSEVRALYDLGPLTPEDKAEFAELFPAKVPAATPTPQPASAA